MRLDHIGIAVRSVEEAARVYVGSFGAVLTYQEDLPGERVRVAFLDAGTAQLELLEPLEDDGPLAKFLSTRGEGLHHIAFGVDDIEQALALAQAAGHRAIDARPRPGSRGRMIAFLHPASTRGVLIELVQTP